MRIRFSIREVMLVTAIVVLALAWWTDHRRLMFELGGYGGPLSAGQGYEKCRTLAESVQLAQGQMAQDGKREYAALLTENGVRAAIRTAISDRDAKLDKIEMQRAGTKEYWQKTVKPTYVRIIETDLWPANCSFGGFYRMDNYDGLGLRLTIKTPGDKFDGYSLPILDLWFGRGGG